MGRSSYDEIRYIYYGLLLHVVILSWVNIFAFRANEAESGLFADAVFINLLDMAW